MSEDDIAEELRGYVTLFLSDRPAEYRVDFDVDDAVAEIETDDDFLYAELRGVGFDVRPDHPSGVVTVLGAADLTASFRGIVEGVE